MGGVGYLISLLFSSLLVFVAMIVTADLEEGGGALRAPGNHFMHGVRRSGALEGKMHMEGTTLMGMSCTVIGRMDFWQAFEQGENGFSHGMYVRTLEVIKMFADNTCCCQCTCPCISSCHSRQQASPLLII